jgi:hypothetical protein
MIKTDKDALECDLAETYHIYNMKELPASRVALFATGLRANSRIMLKLNNSSYPTEALLLAACLDRLSLLLWSKTKDAEHGKNRPASVYDVMTGQSKEKEILTFASGEEFERARNLLLKGGNLNG